MRTFITSWSLVFFTLSAHCRANEPIANPEQVRAAITRGLPFMEKEGTAWMEKRKCISCHQIPSMVWSFNATQHHGFAVDAAKLAGWNEWALKGAFNGSLVYKLPEKAFADLLKDGASESDVAKLRAMKDREFLKDSDFWQAVREQLAAEATPKLTEQILKAAIKPASPPGAGATPSAAYAAILHAGVAEAVKAPDQAQTALLEGLVRSQQKDGLWKTGSQFEGMNRPKDESTAINTAWILLALTYIDPLPEPVLAARDRALAALRSQPTGVSTESVLVRLMLAHRSGEAKQEAEWHEKLLQLQRADGGWAFRSENPDSDALTTGQVLYALTTIGDSPSNEPLQRTVHYLLKGQQADGSWSVPWIHFNVENKKDHTDGTKVFSYWGSGWAIIGLLNTLDG